MKKTKVIFRVFKGEVVALFPKLPGTNDPYTCLSYQAMGRNCASSVELFYNTRPAKPAEYADLAAELERLGYRLSIRKRFTRADRIDRQKQINQKNYGIL